MSRLPEFGIVPGGVVQSILKAKLPECLAVVRDAYVQYGDGRAINPHSQFLKFPSPSQNRIIALPACIGDGPSGVKWIASYPGNVTVGLPRASAVVVLNDAETGYPYACLEGGTISAARTVCSAALFAELARPERCVQGLTLVGTGLISRWLYSTLLACGWSIGSVELFDKNVGDARRFAQEVVQPQHQRETSVHERISEAVARGDLVVFATTASSPHFDDLASLASGALVLHLSLRDLGERVVMSSVNVTDSVEHVLREGTSLERVRDLLGHTNFLHGTIYDVIAGRLELEKNRPCVFSPFGLGVLDIALAEWVFREAERAGRVEKVERFFGSLAR